MLRRLPSFAVLGSGVLFCLGCTSGSLSVNYHDHRPARRTHVHRTHVHTHRCPDCYYDGDRLIVIKGHRHGPGCGHRWDGHRWVPARKSKAPPKLVTPRRTVRKSGPVHKEPRVHEATPADRAKRNHHPARVRKSKSSDGSRGTQKSQHPQKSKSWAE